jgi:hypothetical protein
MSLATAEDAAPKTWRFMASPTRNTFRLICPSNDSFHTLLGMLQTRRLEELKGCYCDAQAVAQRVPSESEYIGIF